MKQTNTILAIILLVVLAGCGENKQSTDDLITVDVSKSYPKKELILQDFMDVEYIALETTDEFLTQGLVKDVGKKCLLVTNRNNDGDIFIFDRKTGKGVRKINRQGPGAEEYTRINEIILDESNGEIFVKSPGNKIQVYDKEEKSLYQVAVYNNDYAEKRTVAMTAKSINREIENVTSLNASPLVEIYKKGQLKEGKLKEIASRLDEEDNPVIMLIKQKK